MKTGRAIFVGVIGFAASSSLYADHLAEAATKASAWAKRPVMSSPHALEEFPRALRGLQPPERAQKLETYPDTLFEAAARASAWAKRPVAPTPHALEEFPWALIGTKPPERIEKREIYPGNLFELAAQASAWTKRPIAASPHALEEFDWLLRGYSPPTNAPSTGGKTEKQRHTKASSRTKKTTTAPNMNGTVK